MTVFIMHMMDIMARVHERKKLPVHVRLLMCSKWAFEQARLVELEIQNAYIRYSRAKEARQERFLISLGVRIGILEEVRDAYTEFGMNKSDEFIIAFEKHVIRPAQGLDLTQDSSAAAEGPADGN